MAEQDLSRLGYEAALAELDGLISRLEKGDVELDEAIACYERGSRLARHCAQLLDRTEQKVTQLVVSGSGGLAERPLEAEPAGRPGEPEPAGRAGQPEPAAPAPEAEPPGRPLPADPRVPAPAPARAVAAETRRQRPLPIDPDDIPF